MNGSQIVFGKKYSKEQLIQTFNEAYNDGFILWDTAEVYGMGNSEKLLGECIKNKSNIIISTKFLPNKKYKNGLLKQSALNSIKRLNIEYIDLYWLHQPFCIEENIAEAVELLKEGTIKSLGLSNCSFEQAKKADELLKKYGYSLAAVQNHYSLLSMSDEQNKIIDWCKKNNIIYFGYMILEQGALSGNYSSKHMFPLFSMRRLIFGKNKFIKINKLIEHIKNLAEVHSVKTSQIPIAWAIHKGIVPIIGLTKPEYVQALSEGVKVKLNDNEIMKLEKLAKESGVVCKGSWETNS